MTVRPFDFYLQAADEYLDGMDDAADPTQWRDEVAEAYEIPVKDRHWLDSAIRQQTVLREM